jgi:hypothetical protein
MMQILRIFIRFPEPSAALAAVSKRNPLQKTTGLPDGNPAGPHDSIAAQYSQETAKSKVRAA